MQRLPGRSYATVITDSIADNSQGEYTVMYIPNE